jgi:galactokinase
MSDHVSFDPTVLTPIYGADANQQIARYTAAIAAFGQHFGGDGPLFLVRAPGRVNVIGEHTDYNHGFVLPAALDKDVLLVARPRTDHEVRLVNIEAAFPPVTFTLSRTIPSAPRGDWGNYARGAAQMIAQKLPVLPPGLDLLVSGEPPHGVPKGAGLSSSTALTVGVAVALAHVAGWQPPKPRLAQLCSDAEWYVGTRGGIMDQFAALLGQRDHALFLDCRPELDGSFHTEALPLPTTHRLLVIDSGVHHGNVRGEFNGRVAACRAGVALLRQDRPDITHLRDVQGMAWGAFEPLLPPVITPAELRTRGVVLDDLPNVGEDAPLRVRACCRHVWTENHRVLLAVDALRLGETAELGRLMNEAHASARDDYQISCHELEVLVHHALEVDGCAGARLTGAGWGGSIVALVAEEAVAAFTEHVARAYHAATGRTPAIFPCQAGPGAGVIGAVDHRH